MYDRETIKQEAKLAMKGSRPHFMAVALLYFLLTSGLVWAAQFLTLGITGPASGLGLFLDILLALFSAVLYLGFCRYALCLVRHEPAGTGQLFSAFAISGRAIGLQLMVMLLIFLWTALLCIAMMAAVAVLYIFLFSDGLALLLSLALYVLLVAAVIAVSLRYAMAEYALLERPEDGIMAAIRRSKGMMEGWKGKLFILDLSFLGWDILAAALSLAGFSACLALMGADWLWELQDLIGALEHYNYYYNSGMWLWEFYSQMDSAFSSLMLCTLVGTLVSLPLQLWLMVYRGCARARFYNYVGGYDYEQYMRVQGGGAAPSRPAQEPWERPAELPRTSPPPAEGAEPAPPPETPAAPPSGGGFYTIVPPSMGSQEDPPEPAQPGGDEPPGEREDR